MIFASFLVLYKGCGLIAQVGSADDSLYLYDQNILEQCFSTADTRPGTGQEILLKTSKFVFNYRIKTIKKYFRPRQKPSETKTFAMEKK